MRRMKDSQRKAMFANMREQRLERIGYEYQDVGDRSWANRTASEIRAFGRQVAIVEKPRKQYAVYTRERIQNMDKADVTADYAKGRISKAEHDRRMKGLSRKVARKA